MKLFGYAHNGSIAVVRENTAGSPGCSVWRAFDRSIADGALTPDNVMDALRNARPVSGHVGPDFNIALDAAVTLAMRGHVERQLPRDRKVQA